TTNAAAVKIADALKQGKYLNNPQVNVALTTVRSRQVSVLGMVAKPGRYPLDETSSQLADVIAAGGGIPPTRSETLPRTRDRLRDHPRDARRQGREGPPHRQGLPAEGR